MNLNSRIKNELTKSEVVRKNVSISLPSEKIEDLDQIVFAFSFINQEKVFTRQSLLELAIDDLIQESKKVLNEYGITDIYSLPQVTIEEEKFDTVIFPAKLEGFNRAFLTEDRWYYVRLGEEKLKKIKYVACYVGMPISAITHYAVVKDIVPVTIEGKQKYMINFEGKAIKLDKPVPLGNVPAMSVRANRYVTLEDLKTATSYADLM